MRLGQIARKLSLRSQEIVEFLSSQNIAIEDGVNTRLSEDHVERILQKFAPLSTPEEVQITKTQEDEHVAVAVLTSEPKFEAETDFEGEAEGSVEEAKQEVIKVPKIELQGLKVLGKIELPELRKKNPETADGAEKTDMPPTVSKEKPLGENKKPNVYRRPESKSRKNPIALAREQEELEFRRKREAQQESAKEQRTKNYFKRVTTSAPTKRARLFEEQSEEMSLTNTDDTPKSWFGRLAKWFKT